MSIFQLTEFSGLLNLGVGDFLKKNNELSAMKNVQEDRIGLLKRVPGYSKAAASTVNSTNGVNFLHYYYKPTTDTKYLLAGSDNGSDYTIKYRTTSTWTSLTGGTYTGRAGSEISAANFLNKAFVVGYDKGDATFLSSASINGTVHTTSTATDPDLSGMPQAKFITRYRDRLYVGNCRVSSVNYPSRVYFTEVPVNGALPTSAPDGWPGATPAYWQWPVEVNFVEFGQEDGDEITGIAEACDRLVVFTRNGMWTYDQNSKKKISDIGCDSYKSIKLIGGVLYWANKFGIWRWDGALPQMITGKVQPLFDAIDQATLDTLVGVAFGFEYRLFIGTLTMNGVQYANTWICFDIRRETFYIRCTYHGCKSACRFTEVTTGIERIYFGSTNGYVYKKATYLDGINSDDGNEIDYFFETNLLDFGAAQIVKVAPKVYFYTKNAGSLKYTIDGINDGEFVPQRGQLGTNQIHFRDIEAQGYRMRFKFYGKDQNEPFVFEGMVIEVNGKENE